MATDHNFKVKNGLHVLGSEGVYLTDTNTRLHEGTGNALRISTGTGYVDLGSMNSSWAHFQANKNIYILPNISNGHVAIDGDLQPYSDSTRTLGSSSRRWSHIYGDALTVGGSLTSGEIRATGTTADTSADALRVDDSGNVALFRVRNDGVVLVSDNYLFVNSSSGAYFTGRVRARGGIDNDQGQLSIDSSTGSITFNSNNLTSVGTISSGDITSGNITTSGNIQVQHSGTNNISLSQTSTGGVINARNSSGTSVVVMDGRGTPFIDVTGNLKTGGTTRIDSSGNLSNIGTISSGNITAGNGSTAAFLRAFYSDGSNMTLHGYGLEMNRSASYIRPTSDNDKTLYIGGADASLDWNAIHFRSGNGLYMTGSRFLDNGRNLENIGTINTGQGATEVYLMNQNVRSSDSPTFQDLTIQGNLSITGDINSYNVTDLDVVDKTITLGVGGTSNANNGGGIVVDGANAKLTWSDSASRWTMNKSLQFSDTPTTTNQAMGIFFPGFDKEATSDYTDNAKIIHTTNTGGHTGSVLLIESQNDANDGIAFITNASSPLKHNSSNILTAANFASNITSVSNADTWTTARTITLGGDLSGSVSINGSSNVTLTATVADDSHNHIISNVDGLQSALDGKLSTTGTAANSQLLDSIDSSQFLRSDTDDQFDGTLTIQSGGTSTYGRIRGYPNDNHFIVIRGAVANSSTLSITGSHQTTFVEHANDANEGWYFKSKTTGSYRELARIDGLGDMYLEGNQRVFADNYHPNADTWTTARTITLGGDLSGSVSINGSANVTLTATVANDSHNHNHSDGNFTVNGLLQAGAGSNHISTAAAPFRWQRSSSGQTGQDDNVSVYVDDSNIYFTHNNDDDNDASGYHFRYMTGGTATTLLRFNSSTMVYKGQTVFHTGYHPNADTLTTARTISLGGDVTGSASFNGSSNITITATVGDNSHVHDTWNLNAAVSGQNIDTAYANKFWSQDRGTATNLGTYPGQYSFATNLGGGKSQGIQLASSYGTGVDLWFRTGTDNNSSENGANAWKNWRKLYHVDYHPEADRWTTSRTITLAGDATGSVSFNGSVNKTLTVAIVDDSHNHIISNVDGLQTALDGKAPIASPTFTGDVTIPNKIIHTGDTDTYFQFHSGNQARIVAGGAETTEWRSDRMQMNNKSITFPAWTNFAETALSGFGQSSLNAPIHISSTGVGNTDKYLPFLQGAATHDQGYRTSYVFGGFKKATTGAAWGDGQSGFFMAMGGNDGYPTKEFRFTWDGRIWYTDAGSSTYLDFDTSNTLKFIANGGQKMEINSGGTTFNDNLGIGGNQLENIGNAYFNEYLYHNGDTDTYIRIQDNSWTFRTGGGDRVVIDNSEMTTKDIVVGGTGNGSIKVRHIEGKAHDSAALGPLYLNYNTTNPVTIGHSGNQSDLYLYGALRIAGTAIIDYSRNLSNIGTISASDDITTSGSYTTFGSETSNNYGVIRVAHPQGADRHSRNSSETGAIKITLPVSWTSTMLRFTVKIFEYGSGESFEVVCAGYNYGSGSTWVNTSAYIVNQPNYARDFTVRFGHDGSKCAVYIGETNTNWTYPQVTVTDFQAGFNAASASNWADGWDITLATSFGTITSTINNTSVTDNARRLKVGGTEVIDTSRNLTNIGTISSGAITATNISVGNGAGNTRSAIDTNATYYSYYNTETSPRIQLGRDIGVSGGAGIALGGNSSYALIGTNNTSGSAMYFKAASAVATVTTNPGMILNSSGNLTVAGTISSGAITSSGGLTISGSVDSGGTNFGYYESAGTNIILKGDSNGRSGIFFESEKNGTNINDPSDYGFIQFHSYGYGGNSGESIDMVIGTANDSTDHLILQTPYTTGLKFGYKNATSGTGLTVGNIWHFANDGSGSGLDADTLDGVESGSFLRSNETDTASGSINFTNDDYYFGSRLRHYGDGNTYMQFHAADQWRVVTGGSERLEVNNSAVRVSNGPLLIPDAEYIGPHTSSKGRIKFDASLDGGVKLLQGSNELIEVVGNSGPMRLIFQPSAGEHMYITHENVNTNICELSFYFDNDGTVTESQKFVSDGTIHADGDVIAYSSQTSSDIRLKENVRPLEGSLNKILDLRGVQFDWKEEKRPNDQLGFIAQEVEEVLPEIVKETVTLSEEGKTHKTVNYEAVIPVLVEAIKEQQEQINKLTDRINDLEKGE